MCYSHRYPLFPTQTHMNQVNVSTVAPLVSGSINARDLLAVGTILASLSVRTTAGLFRVGGRDRGVPDASGESLELLFLLVVLVSEAEETVEVTRV